MRNKIIKINGSETCNEILLYITRDDNGSDYISIQAWHYKDNEWWFQFEVVYFDGYVSLEGFINDFSEASAIKFVNAMEF